MVLGKHEEGELMVGRIDRGAGVDETGKFQHRGKAVTGAVGGTAPDSSLALR